LHSPLTFERVDLEAIVFKSFQDLIQTVQMLLPTIVERVNIININFTFVQTTKDFFTDLLGKVGRLFNPHRQSFVAIFAVWSNDG
jgi:hypothetical protein